METKQYQTIRKVLVALPFCLFTFLPLSAQTTFTERLQQTAAGQGTVTVHQGADIDYLVNNAALSTKSATTTTAKGSTTTAKNVAGQPTQPGQATNKEADIDNPTASEAPVDNTKKMIRGGVKVNGYRVQAFAGGNSRKDRQQAEQVGNDIKAAYPDVPIYVHFYSPRWICRVGNYRSYEEAHQMLLSLRKMGFSQATIVKGKITVPSY